MIQRFEHFPSTNWCLDDEVREDAAGRYVLYEDHLSEIKKLREALLRIKEFSNADYAEEDDLYVLFMICKEVLGEV